MRHPWADIPTHMQIHVWPHTLANKLPPPPPYPAAAGRRKEVLPRAPRGAPRRRGRGRVAARAAGRVLWAPGEGRHPLAAERAPGVPGPCACAGARQPWVRACGASRGRLRRMQIGVGPCCHRFRRRMKDLGMKGKPVFLSDPLARPEPPDSCGAVERHAPLPARARAHAAPLAPPFFARHPLTQGANGAGKTTTFKVVTGEVAPDAGDAFVAGASVLLRRAAARRALGYCPQFDGLPATMTGGGLVLGWAAWAVVVG